MEGLSVILWAVGGGFTIMFGLLGFMWSSINCRFDKVDKIFDKFESKIEKLELKMEDIDKRLCRIEGGLHSNSYCSLSNQNNKRKNFHG